MIQQSTPKRNEVADQAKGLATVLVITGHLIACDVLTLPSPYIFYNILNTAHMPLFFLLSGWFSFQMMNGSFVSVLKKASLRLLLPYVVWSSIAVVAKALVAFIHQTFSLRDSISLWGTTLLLGTSLWFFLALFLTWLLAWLVFQLEKHKKWLTLLVLLAIMLIPFPQEKKIYALERLHDLMPVFYIGFFARRSIEDSIEIPKRMKNHSIIVSSILLALSPWIVSGWGFVQWSHWRTPLLVVIDLVLVSGVFIPCGWLMGKLNSLGKIMGCIGRHSMDIYCIHMVFVEYLRFQMPRNIINAPQIVSSICYFVEAFIIALLSKAIAKVLKRIKLYDCLMSGKWTVVLTNRKQ